MGLLLNVRFVGKSASRSGKTFNWEGQVSKGTHLISVLDTIAHKGGDVISNAYNQQEKRLHPYHILFVNEKVVMPEELNNIVIEKDTSIKIIPFVSGG